MIQIHVWASGIIHSQRPCDKTPKHWSSDHRRETHSSVDEVDGRQYRIELPQSHEDWREPLSSEHHCCLINVCILTIFAFSSEAQQGIWDFNLGPFGASWFRC